jgi:hypothetical protein
MAMPKRHFIVNKLKKEYVLKEIDNPIAKAVSVFGVVKGEYRTQEEAFVFFYFFPVSRKAANELAKKLSLDLLQEQQSEKFMGIYKSEISQGSDQRM